MIIKLEDCKKHMNENEAEIYYNKTATEFFRYIYETERFQEIIDNMKPQTDISEEDWLYLFEKLYLVTYKSLREEASPRLSDSLIYLISKIGVTIFPKDNPKYKEYYKDLEIIRSVYRNRKVDDDLLRILTEVMETKDIDDMNLLLQLHQEVCILRNNRDYLYRESLKSQDGVISVGERTAINSFNRSYEREKELVLTRDSML